VLTPPLALDIVDRTGSAMARPRRFRPGAASAAAECGKATFNLTHHSEKKSSQAPPERRIARCPFIPGGSAARPVVNAQAADHLR
jgi:hypothetical protein